MTDLKSCEGNCEKHIGDVVLVKVTDWGSFHYCQAAIEKDRRNGFTVVVWNERKDDIGEPAKHANK